MKARAKAKVGAGAARAEAEKRGTLNFVQRQVSSLRKVPGMQVTQRALYGQAHLDCVPGWAN